MGRQCAHSVGARAPWQPRVIQGGLGEQRTPLTAKAADSRTRVLYVGGAGRSGSTLLGRAIASGEGVFTGGELRYIWDRGLRDNQLCSCGAPFRSCPFWTEVFLKAFGGFDWIDAGGMLRLKNDVDRLRYVPMLAFPLARSRDFRGRLDHYGDVLGRLYDAIRLVSGSSIVLDSSLDASYAYLLAATPSIDLGLIHLVRDSRAVAHSWQRRQRRPEVQAREEFTPRWSASRASRNWLVANLLIGQLRRRVTASTVVRYEDYASDPTAVHDRLSDVFDLPRPALTRKAFEFAAPEQEHLIAGNPMRFSRGPIRILLDDEWTRAGAPRAFAVTTLHTWPLLLRYRYPVLVNDRERR